MGNQIWLPEGARPSSPAFRKLAPDDQKEAVRRNMLRRPILVKDEETRRERLIFITAPESLEPEELNYLIEGQVEITKQQLRKLGPKPQSKLSIQERRMALRDYLDWRRMRSADPGYKRVY